VVVRLLVQIALVSLGSALGGLTRWGVSLAAARLLGHTFPWGTLFINVTGSLFLGWFATAVADRVLGGSGAWLSGEDLRLLVGVGFTGAYTTFSTYEYEAHALLGRGDRLLGTAYLLGSVLLGLLAVQAGARLARLG
jgi:CrcB protein